MRTWRGTSIRLPDGAPRSWRDHLSGETVAAAADGTLAAGALFRHLPVALLGQA
jgi:maltooligosyltrehalose synthase